MGADGSRHGGADHLESRADRLIGRDPKQQLEALERVFAALAHPARRQILLTVHFRGGSMTAGEIAGRFAHAWPTTTRHLRVLEEAGLVHQRRKGRSRVYRIDRARLAVVREWLAWFDDREGQATRARSPRRLHHAFRKSPL